MTAHQAIRPHPLAIVDAVHAIASRHPSAHDNGRSLIALLAVELGAEPEDVENAEVPVVDLNAAVTRFAPLHFEGKALEHWNLIDDLASAGWRWDKIAERVEYNYWGTFHTTRPPF